jgi:hypothetical protein
MGNRYVHFSEQLEFSPMLAHADEVAGNAADHLRNELAQFSVAEHDNAIFGGNAHLLQDSEGCCEGFGEDGDIVANGRGDQVQIFFGQGHVFGEGAVSV